MPIYQKGSVKGGTRVTQYKQTIDFCQEQPWKRLPHKTHNNFFQAQNTYIWLGKASQIKGATRKITTLLNWFKMHRNKKDFSGEQVWFMKAQKYGSYLLQSLVVGLFFWGIYFPRGVSLFKECWWSSITGRAEGSNAYHTHYLIV